MNSRKVESRLNMTIQLSLLLVNTALNSQKVELQINDWHEPPLVRHGMFVYSGSAFT